MSDATNGIDKRPFYLLTPSFVAITGLVVIPMSFILVYSFYENIDLAVDRVAFQFGNWEELFTDSYYHAAIWKTLKISVLVTVMAAVLGYVPAYFIAMTRFRHKWLLLLLLILPFWVSFIISSSRLTLLPLGVTSNESCFSTLASPCPDSMPVICPALVVAVARL